MKMLDLILTSQKYANVTPLDAETYWVWTATGDLQTHMRVLFSSDAGQFQLLFLLLPCAVSVPSPFPVPFQFSSLFQCLFTVCVRLPVILPCDSLFC